MRDARYVRLISWTLQSGSEHLPWPPPLTAPKTAHSTLYSSCIYFVFSKFIITFLLL
jgi:hypothetical protein